MGLSVRLALMDFLTAVWTDLCLWGLGGHCCGRTEGLAKGGRYGFFPGEL